MFECRSCCEVVMNPLRGSVGPIRRQKGAAADVKKPPSRRRVVCGIDGCEYDGEYRLHPRHRQLVHSGKKQAMLMTPLVWEEDSGVGFRSHLKIKIKVSTISREVSNIIL